MRARYRKRAFTVLEVLLAISILSIGLVSVVALFPMAIYAHRQMIDQTKSVFIERQAMDIMRANRVADYLASREPVPGWGGPWRYPGDNTGAGTSLYELANGWSLAVFRDIDGNYPNSAPAGWEHVWTTWDDLARTPPAAGNLVPLRPDATATDAVQAVPERVFSDYSWSANIYEQNTITVNGSNLQRYRLQIAIFRGYDVVLTTGANFAAGNDAATGKGYIEGDAGPLADVLAVGHGYVRVLAPVVDPLNQLWYRVESVHRNINVGGTMRTRLVLSEAFRGATIPSAPTDVQTSENIVQLVDSVLVGQ